MRSSVRVSIAGLIALWFMATGASNEHIDLVRLLGLDGRSSTRGEPVHGLDYPQLMDSWSPAGLAGVLQGGDGRSSKELLWDRWLHTKGSEENETLARAYVYGARRRSDDFVSALGEVERAVRMGPHLPATHLAHADLHFQQSPAAIQRWAPPLWRAVRAIWEREGERRPFAANAGILFLASLALAGAFALLWGFARRLPALLHDLSHLSGGTLARWQIFVLLLTASLTLAAVGLGPALVALLLVGLAWLYLPSAERSALASWVVLLAFSPFALAWLMGHASWAASPAAALEGVEHRGDVARLPEVVALAMREELPEAIFVLARLQKEGGSPQRARELYERALELRPGWAEAAVNLANLYLTAGETEEAESLYLAAIEQEPDLAEAHFNLSKLYYRSGKLLSAQANRQEALELRPTLAEAYGQEEEREGSLRLLDVALPMAAIAPLGFVAPPEGFTDEVAAALWAPLDSHSAPIAALLALLLLELSLFARVRIAPSPACKSCGAPLCVRCHPLAGDDGETCGPCGRLEGRKDALDPLARQRQLRRVERHQTSRKAVVRLAAILGMGGLAAGRAWEGVVWLAVLLFLGGAAAGLAFLAPAVEPWPAGLRLTLLALPLGLVYLVAVFRGWRHGG